MMEEPTRQISVDSLGWKREIWRLSDGPGISSELQSGVDRAIKSTVLLGRLYQEDIESVDILRRLHEPPPNVALEDKAAFAVLSSYHYTSKELHVRWPLDFNTKGAIIAERPNRGRPALTEAGDVEETIPGRGYGKKSYKFCGCVQPTAAGQTLSGVVAPDVGRDSKDQLIPSQKVEAQEHRVQRLGHIPVMSGLSSGNKAPQTLPEWLATPDDAAVKPDTRPKRQHTALQDSGPDKHQDTKRQRLDQAPTAAVKAATLVANKTPPMSDPVQVREASNRLEDRLDSIRDDLRAHQDEHSSLKSKASDAQKHLAQRDVKINSLEGQLLDLQKKLETSVHECKNEKRAAKSDRLEVIKLRYQASTAKNKSDADNAKITKLEEQLAAMTKKHDTIRNALTRLLQEVDSDD